MVMDAKTFLLKHRAEVPDLCDRIGTSPNYFTQIAYGHRRPSIGLAKRLAEASNGRLSVAALLGIEVEKRRRIAA
jgi:transcriptional regulator with XRE-family HTH domain